jgi:Spy/CpxP family protein refolding chaperone
MMHRRKYLALALATGLLAAATPALAQTGTTPKPPAPADSGRRMMDPISRMLEQREQLKLTDDQVRQLEQIRTKYQEKYKGHVEQLRRSREARSALRAGMDSARAEIAGVLTPEQEKQVDAMREQWRKDWKDAHRGRHHADPHGKHEHEDGDAKDG